MTFNPILGFDTPAHIGRTWLDIADETYQRIERAVRRGDNASAFKWLRFMDLLDEETAYWWRERGMELMEKYDENTIARQENARELAAPESKIQLVI